VFAISPGHFAAILPETVRSHAALRKLLPNHHEGERCRSRPLIDRRRENRQSAGQNELTGPMTRAIAAVVLAIGASGANVALFGCTGAHPFVREGGANSVEVTFSGNVANALPLAREHCARYERVPRLVASEADLAIFDCVVR